MYKYPLQCNSFSILDRLKVCAFVLNESNKLTIGPKTQELETSWRKYSGAANTIATSSGSTANILLVETVIQTYNYNPTNIVVFAPSTTWASSISCWTMRGCKVVFVDINLEDFSFDYNKLEEELGNKIYQDKIKIIWPTGLIGHPPNVNLLKNLSHKYNCHLFADLCECTLGWNDNEQILNSFDMATTSFFWAHECNAIEMGMLFVKKQLGNNRFVELINTAYMIRNHGLVRSLSSTNPEKERLERLYPDIDPEFLFVKEGTNLRPTDLNAVFGLLDFKRVDRYIQHRKNIWKYFLSKLPNDFKQLNPDIVPFCLPFIYKENAIPLMLRLLKQTLNNNSWECRPVISWIAKAPAYSHLAGRKYFPNSQFLHENGLYVGISNNLTKKDIDHLIYTVNSVYMI